MINILLLICVLINVFFTILFYFKIKNFIIEKNSKLFHGICKELDLQNQWLNYFIIKIQNKTSKTNKVNEGNHE